MRVTSSDSGTSRELQTEVEILMIVEWDKVLSLIEVNTSILEVLIELRPLIGWQLAIKATHLVAVL